MQKQHFEETYSAHPPENYEQFFVPAIGKPLAEDLVEKAQLTSGENIMDVACGTGIVARLATEKVGSKGFVSGLDADPGMLAVARSLDQTIEWYEANAETIPIPDNTFDVVFCQMGLQFFENKVVVLKEMYRILKQGGRLCINVPGPIADLFKAMVNAMKKNISEQAAGFLAHVFSLYKPNEIQEIMLRAGFKNVKIEPSEKELHLPKAEKFLWQYIHSTPLAAVVLKSDKHSLRSLEKDVSKSWQNFSQNGSIIYNQPMVTVLSTK